MPSRTGKNSNRAGLVMSSMTGQGQMSNRTGLVVSSRTGTNVSRTGLTGDEKNMDNV
jgi:hypothetical protein